LSPLHSTSSAVQWKSGPRRREPLINGALELRISAAKLRIFEAEATRLTVRASHELLENAVA